MCLIWIWENVPRYCSFKCRTNRRLKFCQETPNTWDLVKLSIHRVVNRNTAKSSLFAINQWGWFWRGSLLQLTYETDQITIDQSGGASPSVSTHKTWLLEKVVQPPQSNISKTILQSSINKTSLWSSIRRPLRSSISKNSLQSSISKTSPRTSENLNSPSPISLWRPDYHPCDPREKQKDGWHVASASQCLKIFRGFSRYGITQSAGNAVCWFIIELVDSNVGITKNLP